MEQSTAPHGRVEASQRKIRKRFAPYKENEPIGDRQRSEQLAEVG